MVHCMIDKNLILYVIIGLLLLGISIYAILSSFNKSKQQVDFSSGLQARIEHYVEHVEKKGNKYKYTISADLSIRSMDNELVVPIFRFKDVTTTCIEKGNRILRAGRSWRDYHCTLNFSTEFSPTLPCKWWLKTGETMECGGTTITLLDVAPADVFVSEKAGSKYLFPAIDLFVPESKDEYVVAMKISNKFGSIDKTIMLKNGCHQGWAKRSVISISKNTFSTPPIGGCDAGKLAGIFSDSDCRWVSDKTCTEELKGENNYEGNGVIKALNTTIIINSIITERKILNFPLHKRFGALIGKGLSGYGGGIDNISVISNMEGQESKYPLELDLYRAGCDFLEAAKPSGILEAVKRCNPELLARFTFPIDDKPGDFEWSRNRKQ